MNLDENSKILVVGLGKKTGLSVCNFLARVGCRVYVSDIKSESELKDIISLLDKRVTVFVSNQSPLLLDNDFDLIVLSPGVPKTIPLISEAKKKGINVISEIELAYWYMRGYIIAITGTDGKSTTTTLVGHILKGMGIKTFVGGNLGTPLISFINDTDCDSVTVAEVSSFQLETIKDFKPDIAAILNIAPDHLDRYKGMDDYISTKLRVSMNQVEEDCFIYNRDDQVLSTSVNGIKANRLCFSLSNRDADAFYKDGSLYIRLVSGVEEVLETDRLQIFGIHNIKNTMAAILIVSSIMEKMNNIEIDFKSIKEGCYSFKGLPHRMESVGEYNGRCFINDSKATTISAVEMAIQSIPGTGILILGGRTKGDDYARLASSIKRKIKYLILIGESTNEFEKLFKDFPYEIASSMDDAVLKAMKASVYKDVIILSPACASYDMFESFEERGAKFKEAFRKLNTGDISWT